MHYRASNPRIAPLSLALLAALSGACSSVDATLGEAGTASSPTTDPSGTASATATWGGDESGGQATSGNETWGGTDASASASASDTNDPSAGDSEGAGTTGGEPQGTTGDPNDETTGEASSSSGTTGEEAVCDVGTPVVLYLSPDDSNSTSSPVQAREAVLGDFGNLNWVPIRTWEFLNYYSFDYAPAEPGQIRVVPELARFKDQPDGQYTMQIGISSEAIPAADRPLMNVTLVLDESGSMSGHPMDMQREVCRTIAASLRKGDVVSMVGWDTTNAIKLEGYVVQSPSDPTIVDECNALEPGGGTDLSGGLNAGYKLATEHFSQGRINRVVLVSDGGANAGETDISVIATGAGDQGKDGIYLVGVGVGTSESYSDQLMDVVTDAGKGASLFIPSKAEASKMFKDRFVSTMMVAARDVRVRLDMPPGFEIVKFSGEEFSTDPSEIEPQHLAPNDSMVFHQTVETCAPELVDAETTFTITTRYQDAVTFEIREVEETRKIAELLSLPSANLLKGAAVFAYAEGLKAVAKGDMTGKVLALEAVALAEAALPGDQDLAEIRSVLEAL
jgi:Ca-activated chloride channel family protein